MSARFKAIAFCTAGLLFNAGVCAAHFHAGNDGYGFLHLGLTLVCAVCLKRAW